MRLNTRLWSFFRKLLRVSPGRYVESCASEATENERLREQQKDEESLRKKQYTFVRDGKGRPIVSPPVTVTDGPR